MKGFTKQKQTHSLRKQTQELRKEKKELGRGEGRERDKVEFGNKPYTLLNIQIDSILNTDVRDRTRNSTNTLS